MWNKIKNWLIAAVAVTLGALLIAMKRRSNAASTLSQSERTTGRVQELKSRDEELKSQYEKLVPRNGDPDEVRRRLRERGLIK